MRRSIDEGGFQGFFDPHRVSAIDRSADLTDEIGGFHGPCGPNRGRSGAPAGAPQVTAIACNPAVGLRV